MSIGYTWRIGLEVGQSSGADGRCDASGVAKDVESVSAAIADALRREYGHRGPDALARVLTAYWGPLRHSMLTDGVSATATPGGRWESSAGPISVTLWCL